MLDWNIFIISLPSESYELTYCLLNHGSTLSIFGRGLAQLLEGQCVYFLSLKKCCVRKRTPNPDQQSVKNWEEQFSINHQAEYHCL